LKLIIFGVQPKKHNGYKKACITQFLELTSQNSLKFHTFIIFLKPSLQFAEISIHPRKLLTVQIEREKNRKRKENVPVKTEDIRKFFTPATRNTRCDNPPGKWKNCCYRNY